MFGLKGNPNYVIAIIIVVVIVFIYLISCVLSWNTNANEDYLYGFYTAEASDFCEKSEIDSMMLFIGRPLKSGMFNRKVTRAAYIIIMPDMCNQGITLTYTPSWAGPGIGKYKVQAQVEFDDIKLWSDEVTLDLNIKTGTLRIYGRDEDNQKIMYAMLHKNHEITNLAVLSEDAELVDDIPL
jgi:hypothetical protein